MATDHQVQELDENYEHSLNASNGHKFKEHVAASAALPPAMADVKQHTADEVVKMLNKTPLFMTELDETNEEGNENVALEAIKAMVYEGSRAEQAENFRQQGNEHARVKNWSDAKAFYTRAIAVLKAPPKSLEDRMEEMPDMEIIEIDEEAEARREKGVEEAVFVNRALCNLELKNFRSCNLDCATTLRINPSNTKAWYRSASACLAIDKIPEAVDACKRGLNVDPNNSALKLLSTKIQEREKYLGKLSKQRQEREERQKAEARILKLAIKARNIPNKTTGKAPEMEDATLKLENPLDASSTLSIPTMLLYPLHLQTDFIKDLSEHISLQEQLSYILPLPWDEQNEYTLGSVDCYMETASGGLIKVGKKLPMTKSLTTGKVEIVDGMLKIYIIPRVRAQNWIDEFKRKRGSAG